MTRKATACRQEEPHEEGAVRAAGGIMALILAGPVQGQDLKKGLVLPYSFDADGGDVVPDSSG